VQKPLFINSPTCDLEIFEVSYPTLVLRCYNIILDYSQMNPALNPPRAIAFGTRVNQHRDFRMAIQEEKLIHRGMDQHGSSRS